MGENWIFYGEITSPGNNPVLADNRNHRPENAWSSLEGFDREFNATTAPQTGGNSEPESKRRAAGCFYLTKKDHIDANNCAILTVSNNTYLDKNETTLRGYSNASIPPL